MDLHLNATKADAMKSTPTENGLQTLIIRHMSGTDGCLRRKATPIN